MTGRLLKTLGELLQLFRLWKNIRLSGIFWLIFLNLQLSAICAVSLDYVFFVLWLHCGLSRFTGTTLNAVYFCVECRFDVYKPAHCFAVSAVLHTAFCFTLFYGWAADYVFWNVFSVGWAADRVFWNVFIDKLCAITFALFLESGFLESHLVLSTISDAADQRPGACQNLLFCNVVSCQSWILLESFADLCAQLLYSCCLSSPWSWWCLWIGLHMDAFHGFRTVGKRSWSYVCTVGGRKRSIKQLFLVVQATTTGPFKTTKCVRYALRVSRGDAGFRENYSSGMFSLLGAGSVIVGNDEINEGGLKTVSGILTTLKLALKVLLLLALVKCVTALQVYNKLVIRLDYMIGTASRTFRSR